MIYTGHSTRLHNYGEKIIPKIAINQAFEHCSAVHWFRIVLTQMFASSDSSAASTSPKTLLSLHHCHSTNMLVDHHVRSQQKRTYQQSMDSTKHVPSHLSLLPNSSGNSSTPHERFQSKGKPLGEEMDRIMDLSSGFKMFHVGMRLWKSLIEMYKKMTVAFQTNPELNRLFLAAHLGVLLHYPVLKSGHLW